jgi:hypothetical protein
MTIIRAQVAWGADLPDIRHRFVITPHFNHQAGLALGSPDWQSLCDDLATSMAAYSTQQRETTVKLYDAQQAAPAYPQASKTLNLGDYPASTSPRELALCLSYKAGDGPRRRGRLYVPFNLTGSTTVGKRPVFAHMEKVAALAPLLRALGGANVQWGVWSRRDSAFYPAQTAYVDDEWDIMRSRGLEPTTTLPAGTGS